MRWGGPLPQSSFSDCSMWRVGVSKCMDLTSRAIGWWIPNYFGLLCGGLYVLLPDSGESGCVVLFFCLVGGIGNRYWDLVSPIFVPVF